MKFKLSRYIIPAIIAMVVVGTNANIDGFFIGGILADDGLAAINFAWPVVAILTSVGTGVGIGGSVIMNNARGMGDDVRADGIKHTVVALLVLASAALGTLFFFISEPFLALMGAADAVLTHALEYSAVISAGALALILGSAVLVLLRNEGKTYQSMIYSFVGLALHVVLNFILADRFVMLGVALATVISQGVVALLGIISLRFDVRRAASASGKDIADSLLNSIAPLGLNLVPSLVLIWTNNAAISYGSVAAVSAYAAMSYAIYTFDYIFQGICDGIQPIVSYCRGSGDMAQEKHAVKRAALIMGVFSLICIALTPALTWLLPMALGVSEDASAIIASAFRIYAISYPFKAVVKFVSAYYYAIGKRIFSNITVYLDPLLLTPVSLLLLTRSMGDNGIWVSMPLTQIILTVIIAAVMLTAALRSRAKRGSADA